MDLIVVAQNQQYNNIIFYFFYNFISVLHIFILLFYLF